MPKPKAYMNWSGGKDSAFSLYKVLQEDRFQVAAILTTINKENKRVSMHGTPESLLHKQAESLEIPLKIVEVPDNCDIKTYNSILEEVHNEMRNSGFQYSIFGDIFLEDLKDYRENQFSNSKITPLFPIWKMNTNEIIQEFINTGFKTITTCVNSNLLDKNFLSQIIDKDFIKRLPEKIDPCGENGEFHSFTFDGPIFKNPINFKLGRIVSKKYKSGKSWNNKFLFIDLKSL